MWQGELNGWVACEVEYDGTGGFNTPGEVILHTPTMHEAEFAGVQARWLRCRLSDTRQGQRMYYASPFVDRLRVEARGGTVGARHATTIRDGILGQSDGTPGQTFTLQHAPLLARDRRRPGVIVEGPALIAEYSATTLLARGWRCEVLPSGALLLTAISDGKYS